MPTAIRDFRKRTDSILPNSRAKWIFRLTYRALQSGELDIIAGNSTDGLISALDLFQLEDDRRYFPPYQAVFIARQEVDEMLREAFEQTEQRDLDRRDAAAEL